MNQDKLAECENKLEEALKICSLDDLGRIVLGKLKKNVELTGKEFKYRIPPKVSTDMSCVMWCVRAYMGQYPIRSSHILEVRHSLSELSTFIRICLVLSHLLRSDLRQYTSLKNVFFWVLQKTWDRRAQQDSSSDSSSDSDNEETKKQSQRA